MDVDKRRAGPSSVRVKQSLHQKENTRAHEYEQRHLHRRFLVYLRNQI